LLAGIRDFRVLWLIAGILAAFLGKGLFLHYLLLFAPPFALLSAHALAGRPARKAYFWIGAQYVLVLAVLAIPFSGVFWGTDLVYFEQLSLVMRKALRAGERVMVWGGSALPLTYTGAEHVTRFVLPRFAVSPYGTHETSEMFHQELARDVPDLILDLHERGDNQFNNPLESEAYVSQLVRTQYHAYICPTVPWAKFYFRQTPPPEAGLIELADSAQLQAAYAQFPREQQSWMTLAAAIHEGAPVISTDWRLRARAGLELLERQSPTPLVKLRAQELLARMATQPMTAELQGQIQAFAAHASVNGLLPLPMVSVAWWPTVAMVELQPKAMKY
jgi:hypothetical protein